VIWLKGTRCRWVLVLSSTAFSIIVICYIKLSRAGSDKVRVECVDSMREGYSWTCAYFDHIIYV
jgi:hypothetical protein